MPDNPTNAHEFTVTELAMSLKRTVEDTFGHVRVKGELGRVTIAKSGHVYLDIKDDKAVINSIIWKGVAGRLPMRPEEGMEVVVEGKLSTYPGRSNYQLIIDKMELAGAGALMALLEQRKRKLQGEGLFSDERKQALPFLPKTIGVITSPTGAVIRDILHRIEDRFPSHVLVWPVLVQGDKAAEQISAAITGFNHAEGFPRPDVLIVARGGGSLEDLWCFNAEVVARAAAASNIPLISAVGHETDWTIIDYISDYRAPTPTGAAEVAVPVRVDYLETVADYGVRLTRGLRRNVNEKKSGLAAAKLPRLDTVLSAPRQRLDLAASRLPSAQRLIAPMGQRLALAVSRLPNAARLTDGASQRLSALLSRLAPALTANQRRHQNRLTDTARRLRPDSIQRAATLKSERTAQLSRSAETAIKRKLERDTNRLARAGKLLDAYSYQGVLERGFALVRDEAGQVVRSNETAQAGEAVRLTFADGDRAAVIEGNPKITSKPTQKKTKAPKHIVTDKKQADLF